MSKNEYLKAIKLLKHIVNRIYYQSGSTKLDIADVEKKLGVHFSISYRMFLESYGYLSFEGSEILGLYNNSLINRTQQERLDNSFPRHLIPIHALGNGELSCLDTSQMNEEGECPVVAWYFGATLPNGKYEVLAEDFGAFLLEKVIWGLESLEEDGVVVDWENFRKS